VVSFAGSLFCFGAAMSNAGGTLEKMLGEDGLRVRLKNAEYPVRSMDSLSPREFWFVMSRGRKFASMGSDELAARQTEITQALDQIYKIIAPEFPRYKPGFFDKLKGGYIKWFALSLAESLTILQAWIEMGGAKESAGEERDEAEWDDVFTTLSYWYHIPYGDVCNMPMSAIRQYMEKLKVQRAATRLMLAETAGVPHMSKEAHRDWFAEIDEILNDGRRAVEVLSPAMMSMLGIGFMPRKEATHG